MISSKEVANAIKKVLHRNPKEAEDLIQNLPVFASRFGLSALLPSISIKLENWLRQKSASDRLSIKLGQDNQLTPELEDLIRQKLKAADAKTDVSQAQELLAGFVAEYKGVVLDGGASGQLQKLGQQIQK